MDGGFPATDGAISSLEGLRDLAARLRHRFTSQDVEGIMGANWISFLTRALPA